MEAETIETNNILRLSCQQLKESLEKGENPILVDIRPSTAYSSGHLPQAVNFYYDPFSDPAMRAVSLSVFPANKLLIFYCD